MTPRIVLLCALSFAASRADAFCGFFVAGSNAKLTNSASQVALVRQGTRTSMTMSNDYKGPLESFAMVVPVPSVLHEKDVKTLEATVFDRVDALSAPRLVEYWQQDPCNPRPPPMAPRGAAIGALEKRRGADLGVKIEEQFAVGEYQIVILSAKESGGLETWLRESHYTIPDGAAAALAPYVASQMKFFVAKVDVTKVKKNQEGVVQLSPLRVQFESNELRLPIRLGLLNAGPKQDLIVYVLSPDSRYEVANYPNVFSPTNLDVVDSVRETFASFYAALFDATIAKQQGKAIVTEYAWQTTSCDPCPTAPLSNSEIVTLGANLGPNARDGVFGAGAGWVLTRLHARYDKTTLADDLVFQAAKPLAGGRGDGADAPVVQAGGLNNFQARYIIRHRWKGKVACKAPMWNMWGGPAPGDTGQPPTQAARGLAGAPRGKVELGKLVRTAVPELGLPGIATK